MHFQSSNYYLKIFSHYKVARFYFGNFIRFLSKKKFQKSISPSEAVTIFGENFSKHGNHFIINFLNEYSLNNKIDYIESSLGKFHKQFCPKTTEEALGVSTKGNGLRLFNYPWGVFGRQRSIKRKDPRNSRFCGPSTEKFIIDEAKSIIKLYVKIKKDGYQPTKYPNSFIQGVWMIKKNGEKRFVVLQGNHRMAVLSYLGYKSIDVRCDMFPNKYIKEKDLNSWVNVKLNNVSSEKALEIFNSFFKY